ncbi:MAG TPA: hypothetical protein VGD26_07720 [Chitinophagaceae bacterium]
MKIIRHTITRLTLMIISLFVSVSLIAQEGGGADVNVDINKDGGGAWYASPWVWIVGAAVFILLLVALLRGGGRRD